MHLLLSIVMRSVTEPQTRVKKTDYGDPALYSRVMDERKRIRPTKYSTKAGWASKTDLGDLEQAVFGGVVEGTGLRITV